uniref:Uncharacterized protein n=1 Tax=Riboviria sp. TaxID=2585031 RepID=A0A514DD00_9VIRU|nr:MAG: hypothetical protein H4Bulk4618_000006 [Riboviria sp.]
MTLLPRRLITTLDVTVVKLTSTFLPPPLPLFVLRQPKSQPSLHNSNLFLSQLPLNRNLPLPELTSTLFSNSSVTFFLPLLLHPSQLPLHRSLTLNPHLPVSLLLSKSFPCSFSPLLLLNLKLYIRWILLLSPLPTQPSEFMSLPYTLMNLLSI